MNEWFRRKNSKLQSIPLIERVNRLVGPKLEGFTLARVSGDAQNQRLEEVRNVREYQLTLRNTASVHLQEVEIQFEFPTEDVEGWASRPTLSKTAPVPIEAVVTSPWQKGFRWRIPHLPSTDSIEFGFKAVNPPSPDYEVALYNVDRVVVSRSQGEPTERNSRGQHWTLLAITTALGAIFGALPLLFADHASKFTPLNEAGCTLTIVSSYEQLQGHTSPWPWGSGPWQISNRIVNLGAQKCLVQPDGPSSVPVPLAPGDETMRKAYSISRPKVHARELSFGVESPTAKATVEFYEDPAPR